MYKFSTIRSEIRKFFAQFFHHKFHLSAFSMISIALLAMSGWFSALHYYQVATAVPLISNDVLAAQTLAKTTTTSQWVTVTIKSHDTLQTIFKQAQLDDQQLMAVLAADASVKKTFKNLMPGQTIKLLIDSDQQLEELAYAPDSKNPLTIVRTDTGFALQKNTEPSLAVMPIPVPISANSKTVPQPIAALNPQIHYGNAIINKSLYEAGSQAGLSHSQVMQLVTLFSQNSTLTHSIHRGDQLTVLYEPQRRYILMAKLIHKKKTYEVFRFTDSKGNTDYYTQDGLSLRPTLVRAPLNYTHISSRFSAHRWQPILHFFRPHYGVDYAAPYGTPVKAAGDGHLIFAGEENGYGNTVKIKHPGAYETVYAHLSRFAKGLHKGSVVHQGQVIGYVGDTGLATGSHLHFEIRVNNVPRNPLTVALPSGTPLAKTDRLAFSQVSLQLLNQLALHKTSTQLADK